MESSFVKHVIPLDLLTRLARHERIQEMRENRTVVKTVCGLDVMIHEDHLYEACLDAVQCQTCNELTGYFNTWAVVSLVE